MLLPVPPSRLMPPKFALGGDIVDSRHCLLDLCLICRFHGRCARRVGGGEGQRADALELVGDFVQRGIRRFDHVDPILGVLRGLVQALYLGAQVSGDHQSGGVIRRTVDAKPGTELPNSSTHIGIVCCQIMFRGHRGGVGCDVH